MPPAALLWILAVLLSVVWILFGRTVLLAARQMRMLADLLAAGPREPERSVPLPSLSVIVTACNEAAGIEASVRRLLAQEYPDLQIVVVDDRSTDGTGEILDRLAAAAPGAQAGRLSVIHNRSVPAGWLGKCNACRLGAERARGEWILFSDGDVELAQPDLLARVVRHAERHGLDHVAVAPDVRPMSGLQSGVMAVFGQLFLLAARAHEMDRDLPRGGAGVGAFNLMRRAAYERVGGHRLLRMDPADDMKLGMLLKETGSRQRLYHGAELVRCPWHRGVRNLVRGLEKNFFPGCGYSVVRTLLVTAGLSALNFGPPAVALLGTWMGAAGSGSWPRAAGLAVLWLPAALEAFCLIGGYWVYGRRSGVEPWVVLLHPLSMLILIIALWNSTLRTLMRGGIVWRGTFYPLAELRPALVRPGDGRRFLQAHENSMIGAP